ncbi:MAG: glycoside hydrolase/phage tail family protein [Paracoccaceae bacterium]
MATVLLSAAGAAIGGSIGGTVAGLSSAVVGRAIGATLGRVIDQKLLGQGSETVEYGKVDRFRLSNAGEGESISQVFGRMRIGGQVIWASDFLETVSVSGGGSGKGAPSPQPETRQYTYSVNLAVALCAGEILRVGRIWADGEEVSASTVNMRVYKGDADQLPDPTMEAIEGFGVVPAYRGTAYVVFENLQLEQFGNRVPQFSFEVVRAEQPEELGADDELARGLCAVAMMPGTGEYALATAAVTYGKDGPYRRSANVNTPSGKSDFLTSLDALNDEVPGCEATSLIVSWFGGDLRCENCRLEPKVERKDVDGIKMPWQVSGVSRAAAKQIATIDDRPIYGGTPADASVVQSIQALKDAGKAVMFYPFILMDQLNGNTLPDPYSDDIGQAHLPWRGRITLSKAPGQGGTPDQTALADIEVDAFFGTVTASDFTVSNGSVTYSGPNEWTLSRFVLHYAALCAAAGGVEAFCIGSELRGLTQIRGAGGAFPAVARFQQLAAQARLLLGSETKISYAADWSEYFGYQPQDGSGDRYFHLDPLWADANIDFIGIDNYMPLSDWREGETHLDADWESIYKLEYLQSNILGGEGYDWFYHSAQAADAQIRSPILDQEHNEPWVWRYKDIRGWWENAHHERISGIRSEEATAWVPGSKPIWFTEYGCAAVDNGTNEPNKFLDPKSSESFLPKYSNGRRDDLIQKQYYRAMHAFWKEQSNNPTSEQYGGAMVNMDRAFAWAWDARPYPFFPNALDTWSDGENYPRGHWLNGRVSSRTLASVVSEICENSGLTAYDTSELVGYVRGYAINTVSDARSALQPLMLRYGFDAIERDGFLVFKTRNGKQPQTILVEGMADNSELNGTHEQGREAEAELAGRIRLRFVESDGDFETGAEEAILPDEETHAVSATDLSLSMTRGEARQVSERWLVESRTARETVRFALPPSQLCIGAGDVVSIEDDQSKDANLFRVDRLEHGDMQIIDAVRIDPEVYQPSDLSDELARVRGFVAPVQLTSLFLDLPLLSGDEVPHAPHVAVTSAQWPGSAALYQSDNGTNYALNSVIAARSVIGVTQNALNPSAPGLMDRGPSLEVELVSGALSSIPDESLLSGGNLAIVGDGTPGNWEVIQFRDAELIAPNRYLLSNRLRGQLGTDALGADAWPSGSWFVLLNGLPQQIDLPSSFRRIAQTYRIGPAQLTYDDPSFTEETHAFDGNGLRPYSPVHLKAWPIAGGYQASWIRRSRFDGDSWDLMEIPLGEETEMYQVQVHKSGAVVREEIVDSPTWTYDASALAEDGMSAPFDIIVAQVSARFGPGLSNRMQVQV